MTYTFHVDMTTATATRTLLALHNAIVTPNDAPLFLHHSVHFHRPFAAVSLSGGADAMMKSPNAGGSSDISESLSFEVLYRLFGAKLLQTEMAVEYDYEHSPRIDYSATVLGRRVGVSVTRAIDHHSGVTLAEAYRLLYKKLYGLAMSRTYVVESSSWDVSILHVWCRDSDSLVWLQRMFNRMVVRHRQLLSNTILFVSLSSAAPFIYSNRSM